jgi:hypothetical protein
MSQEHRRLLDRDPILDLGHSSLVCAQSVAPRSLRIAVLGASARTCAGPLTPVGNIWRQSSAWTRTSTIGSWQPKAGAVLSATMSSPLDTSRWTMTSPRGGSEGCSAPHAKMVWEDSWTVPSDSGQPSLTCAARCPLRDRPPLATDADLDRRLNCDPSADCQTGLRHN